MIVGQVKSFQFFKISHSLSHLLDAVVSEVHVLDVVQRISIWMRTEYFTHHWVCDIQHSDIYKPFEINGIETVNDAVTDLNVGDVEGSGWLYVGQVSKEEVVQWEFLKQSIIQSMSTCVKVNTNKCPIEEGL